MGFDLFGLNPKNSKGEYFRNNVWWWRRLADFVLEHVELPEEETRYWHSNDGQEVSEASALKIARFLRRALRNKSRHFEWVRNSEEEYLRMEKGFEQAIMAKLKEKIGSDARISPPVCSYPFSWENVRNFAGFCESCGGFSIC